MPPRAAPRSMKTTSPFGQGGTSGGFWALTDNLVWVVDPEAHPGASRHPSEGSSREHYRFTFRPPVLMFRYLQRARTDHRLALQETAP